MERRRPAISREVADLIRDWAERHSLDARRYRGKMEASKTLQLCAKHAQNMARELGASSALYRLLGSLEVAE